LRGIFTAHSCCGASLRWADVGVRPYAGRCKLGHLPRLALVFPEVLNDERLHSGDTEEALGRGVYGEASEVAGNPATVELLGDGNASAGAAEAVEDEIVLV